MRSGWEFSKNFRRYIMSVAAAVVALCTSLGCLAGEGLFLPNYLPNHIGSNKANLNDISSLTNKDLFDRAEAIRDNSLSTAQRALNYQWMSQLHEDEDVTEGSKAFSHLLKRSLKGYWNNKRAEHFNDSKLVPDADGQGSISSGFDYNVRMSSDTVKFGFSYDF